MIYKKIVQGEEEGTKVTIFADSLERLLELVQLYYLNLNKENKDE